MGNVTNRGSGRSGFPRSGGLPGYPKQGGDRFFLPRNASPGGVGIPIRGQLTGAPLQPDPKIKSLTDVLQHLLGAETKSRAVDWNAALDWLGKKLGLISPNVEKSWLLPLTLSGAMDDVRNQLGDGQELTLWVSDIDSDGNITGFTVTEGGSDVLSSPEMAPRVGIQIRGDSNANQGKPSQSCFAIRGGKGVEFVKLPQRGDRSDPTSGEGFCDPDKVLKLLREYGRSPQYPQIIDQLPNNVGSPGGGSGIEDPRRIVLVA